MYNRKVGVCVPMSTFSIMLDMFEFDGYVNVALIKAQLISTLLKDTGRQYIEIVM